MPGRLGRFIAQSVRFAALLSVVGGLGGGCYWLWLGGQQEREREASRELSIKEPARRAIDPTTDEVVIQLDEDTQGRLGLVVEPLEHTTWQRTVKLLGFAIPVPHRRTEVRSPWTGILEAPSDKPMPTVGQKLAAGELLGSLLVQWSPAERIQLETQLRDVRGTIAETEAQVGVAKRTVQRLQDLGEQVLANKFLVEAEGHLAQLEARLRAAQTRESNLQAALGAQAGNFRFPITAPQGGHVTEFSGRPGEVVAAGNLVATLYDSQELWVAIAAIPGTVPLEAIPETATIAFPSLSRAPLSGQFVRRSPQVTPQQQGQELVYRTLNPGGLIPLGLQAEATLQIGSAQEAVRLRSSAVVHWHDRRLVYVARAPTEFVKQFVDVAGEEGDWVYLQPALPKGGRVVVRGTQLLLSEEFKESIQLVEEGARSAPTGPERGEN